MVRRVLGIETSCDETAAAVVERRDDGSGRILANLVYSQISEHERFGGVVPEIAARAHLSRLDGLIEEAIGEAGLTFTDLDAIAVTRGPGLTGGLITGLMTAKALAAATGLPYFAVNHLEGHALTPRLTDAVAFPYLLLLVSGGHTQFLEIAGVGDYRRLATTIDDALGEAFDKTAKLLSLGYPGGPAVEKMAVLGNPDRFQLPRPLAGKNTLNFSFSGLKTALRQRAEAKAPLSETDIADLCAAFQSTIIDILTDRTRRIFADWESRHATAARRLVVAGGVAANKAIRAALEALCKESGWQLIAPPAALCTDNAAMIAWAGLERLDRFPPSSLSDPPLPRWPLDQQVAGVVGAGRKGPKA